MPKVLNEEPAHTNSFILFCNGVESGFMASAYEPSSLTRNSQAGPCTDGPGHNDSSSSSGLPGVTRTVTPFKFIALRPANCPAVACQQGSSHWQAPLPVRAASKLELPGPAGLHATCSQDQEFRVRARAIQVTRKARWARLGPRRISNTSRRKVTRPIRAETSVYSADQ